MKPITPNITAVLDRAKISDRMAARVIAAVLMDVGVTLDDVHLSRESIHRSRQKHRKYLNDLIKTNASRIPSQILTVHWDGKQLSAPEDKFLKIDRLPVLVSGQGWQQLLGVPRLERRTGEGQAKAIYACLEDWDIRGDVCAMVFDTTSRYTSRASGACVMVEKLLERDVLYLACRHHIFELILRASFESSIKDTSGPDVPIFKEFQDQWNINEDDFLTEMEDSTVREPSSQTWKKSSLSLKYN